MTRKLLIALLASAILAGCSKNDAPLISNPYLVVTVLDGATNSYKLVKYNTDGTGQVAFIGNTIPIGNDNDLGIPAVSPQGKKVVYFEGGIMKMMEVKTGVISTVYTHVNPFIGCPAFNADETKIAFSAAPAVDDRADIYIVNAVANATPVKITSNEPDYLAVYPRFSADGSKLTFAYGQFDNANQFENIGIYVSDLQGNNKVRISEAHQDGGIDLYPVFANGGNKVVYSSSNGGITYDLLMSNITEGAEGTATRMIEANASGILVSAYPDITPDGNFIYFIGVDVAGAQSIYKVSVAGGSPVKIKTVVTGTTEMVMNLTYVQE